MSIKVYLMAILDNYMFRLYWPSSGCLPEKLRSYYIFRFEARQEHGCLSVVSVVRRQVAISASG